MLDKMKSATQIKTWNMLVTIASFQFSTLPFEHIAMSICCYINTLLCQYVVILTLVIELCPSTATVHCKANKSDQWLGHWLGAVQRADTSSYCAFMTRQHVQVWISLQLGYWSVLKDNWPANKYFTVNWINKILFCFTHWYFIRLLHLQLVKCLINEFSILRDSFLSVFQK